MYQKDFLCIDKKDLRLYGDWNSSKARLIDIQLIKCTDKSYCKEEEDIKSFLRDKYLLLLSNQIRFDSDLIGNEAFVKESVLEWITVNTQTAVSLPYQMTTKFASLQDEDIDLEDLSIVEYEGLFELSKLPQRSYEKDLETVMNINIELNLDRYFIVREPDTYIDVLADLGGVQSIFITLFSAVLAIVNYSHFDTFMTSRLFKLKKEDADKVEYKSHFDRSNFFEPSKFGNARLFLMDTLPKRLVCCKKSRKQNGIQKAIEAMNFEIDIIEMIKKGRYVNMALKLLLTSE